MRQRIGQIVGVALVVAFFATLPLGAAEKEEPTWHKTFDGHKMWMTSLDKALAASAKEDKPMLIDLFSPT